MASASTNEESSSNSELEISHENPKIIRHNGFKPKNDTPSQAESAGDSGKKSINPKRTPSKAKHLWINYGRKIIEYAITHTEGEV